MTTELFVLVGLFCLLLVSFVGLFLPGWVWSHGIVCACRLFPALWCTPVHMCFWCVTNVLL